MAGNERFYDSQYTSFATGVQAKIRREALDQDIGQNGWLNAGEYREMWQWLGAKPGARILDVACGSGGPSIFMAESTGCAITGVDINDGGLEAARGMARARGVESRATFLRADGAQRLPFEDASFDGIVCIDAINHLRDRLAVLREWSRVLRKGGRVVFTDPIVITGILTSEEIATRTSIGFFLFAAPGEDERLLAQAGYKVLHVEDTTERVAVNALATHDARDRLRDEVVAEEGADVFAAKQQFWRVAGTLARERRLSRFTVVGEKP